MSKLNNRGETWNCERFSYCLMEKDGRYQWRWLPPYPPESNGASFSPVFNSKADAMAWVSQHSFVNNNATFDGWRVVCDFQS